MAEFRPSCLPAHADARTPTRCQQFRFQTDTLPGIPSKTFWRQFKLAGPDSTVKQAMRTCGAWLKRHGKGQWEILIALTPDRAAILSEAWEMRIEMPVTPAQTATDNPF